MAAQDKKSQINLLPQEEFESSLVGRTLKWALSSFRILVIITEMVVMAAFLSRFWLDARKSDLGEEIRQKQSIISSQMAFEKDFKDIQARLAVFSELSEGKIISETLATITSYLPPVVLLSSYTFEEDITIRGLSPNEANVAQLIANLESSNSFEEVSLTNLSIDSQNPGLILFTFKLVPKNI